MYYFNNQYEQTIPAATTTIIPCKINLFYHIIPLDKYKSSKFWTYLDLFGLIWTYLVFDYFMLFF